MELRRVYGVSFTRAAARDLRLRATKRCHSTGAAVSLEDVRVSTLHSLALSVLQRAGLLTAFPVRPLVLDDWEVENIFDAEFRHGTDTGKRRADDIRREHEAFWSTGEWDAANYIQPDPPITPAERAAFNAFHQPTTQTYACVLPGEIIRLCVTQIEAGLLAPAELVDMRELIVDEYQDLNPMDLQFVDALTAGGVRLFVAGDDDQSIYAFRFASPAGIQDFIERFPGAGDHVLSGCFRCATEIVGAATALISHFSTAERIPKTLRSLWETAEPAVDGVVHRWHFNSHIREAQAIAASCARLIEDGLAPADIMLLLSNRGVFPALKAALEAADVPFQPPKEESWIDTDAGRFMLGVLRLVCSPNDYVAHRLVLGCRRGVGVGTCKQIVSRVIGNNLVYGDLFDKPLPAGLFAGRLKTAIDLAREVHETIDGWGGDDVLGDRREELAALLLEARAASDGHDWEALTAALPDGMTMAELRDYIWTDNSEQRHTLVAAVHERLALAPPAAQPEPGIRVLTMHGAKGLQAKVVFIPALEEQVLPGPRRSLRPGLVLEGARLLYVSTTRAQTAVILSFAGRRFIAGQSAVHRASRYAAHLGGPFHRRDAGLTGEEATAILQSVQAMGWHHPMADNDRP